MLNRAHLDLQPDEANDAKDINRRCAERAGRDSRGSAGRQRQFIRLAETMSLSGIVGTPRAAAIAGEHPAPGEGSFDLGNFVLQSGITLRGAKLAFKTHGRLNADKSNAIVYPTPYSAHHSDIEWPI